MRDFKYMIYNVYTGKYEEVRMSAFAIKRLYEIQGYIKRR